MIVSLMSKREELQEELRSVEKQVYELESSYLKDSNYFGNVLKGLKRSRKLQPEDRIFSLSSVTSPPGSIPVKEATDQKEEPPMDKSTKLDTEPNLNSSLNLTSVEDNAEVLPVKSMPEEPQEDGSSKLDTEPNSNPISNLTSIENNAEVSPVRSAPKWPPEDGLSKSDTEPNSNANPRPPRAEDNSLSAILGLKVKLRSNPVRTVRHWRRIQHIVENELIKLQRFELDHSGVNVSDQSDTPGRSKRVKTQRVERASILSDLSDELIKARNEVDLKACLELEAQLFDKNSRTNQIETEDMETARTEDAQNNLYQGRNRLTLLTYNIQSSA
ncbi:Chromatin modification-related protein Eaf6 [Dillenia turbinata]|uniref:Chromatin modification-related protein Eaf6 n=1 Tax=Dillenia turbinata TaxID=194707 RepID=A0AAN8ZUP0_9MAGN